MADIHKTVGALLIGGLIASMFSGMAVVQTFAYFRNYPQDLPRVKLLVVVVSFLDLCHTLFIGISLWDYLVTHFGNGARADFIPTSLALTIAVTAVLTFLVHCFFVHRIYKLSQSNYYIAVPLGAIALLRLGSACLTTAKMIQLRSLAEFVDQYTWSFTLGLALSSLLDVLITGFLCCLLMSGRKKNSSINHVLDSLMLYAFELGSLTCAAVVTSMICWLVMPTNLIFMALHFIISKLYANSLLATLNTRNNLKPMRSQSFSGERGGFSDVRRISARGSGITQLAKVKSLRIQVEEVTTRTVDSSMDSTLDSTKCGSPGLSPYHIESC